MAATVLEEAGAFDQPVEKDKLLATMGVLIRAETRWPSARKTIK